MHRRIGPRFRTPLTIGAAALALALPVAAQSYPKLLTNGRGLAVTQLLLREKSGSSWIATPSYKNGGEYRFTVRLTNFFPTTISVGNPLASCHAFYMVDLHLTIDLPGAVFTTATASGSTVQFGRVSGANTIWVDDFQRLNNTKSRTYYAYFTWNGPNGAPAPLLHPKMGIGGGEVCLLPNQDGVPVPPS